MENEIDKDGNITSTPNVEKSEFTTDLKTEIKRNLDLYRKLWEEAVNNKADRFIRGRYQGQYLAYKSLTDGIKNGYLK